MFHWIARWLGRLLPRRQLALVGPVPPPPTFPAIVRIPEGLAFVATGPAPFAPVIEPPPAPPVAAPIIPEPPTPLAQRPYAPPRPRHAKPPGERREDRPPRVRSLSKKRRASARLSPDVNLHDSVLAQLDRYWVYLARMRKGDRQSYDLLSQVGIRLCPRMLEWEKDIGDETRLSPWWRDHRPGFGAVATDLHKREQAEKDADDYMKDGKCKDEKGQTVWGIWEPKFFYFHKYRGVMDGIYPLSGREGDTYVATVYWDHKSDNETITYKRNRGVPWQFGVVVDPDCGVRLLPCRVNVFSPYSEAPWTSRARIATTKWGQHKVYEEWAEAHKSPVEQHLANMFVRMASLYERAHHEMILIRVKKNGMLAVFTIDVLATPGFFADRQATTLINGRKAPIFHIVGAHSRELPSGKESHVRCHFRGERKFQWNGYEVEIDVPVKYYADDYVFDIPQYDDNYFRHALKEKGGVTLAGIGKMLEKSRLDQMQQRGFN